MPYGGIWPGVYLHHKQGLRRKLLWNYNYIFLKMFILTSGLMLMSYNCDIQQNNKF